MFTGSPAEGMQIRPEQEVAHLAEGDAQSPQRTLDPRLSGYLWLSGTALVRYVTNVSAVAAAQGPAVTKGSFFSGC